MNLKHLIEFDTVEDFWSVWNVLIAPSKLALGSNYHMFRTGIEPKWEDPTNARGGKWVATFPKQRPNPNIRTIDELWLYAVRPLLFSLFLSFFMCLCCHSL